MSSSRRFEVTSQILGKGLIIWGSDFDITFQRPDGIVLKWTWRIASATSPAKWHEEHVKEAVDAATDWAGQLIEDDLDDSDDAEPDTDEPDFVDPAPDAKWITFVTEHGEVLGFQIIKELS